MSQNKSSWVGKIWYGRSLIFWLLLPLSWIYAFLIYLRRQLYKSGLLRVHVVSVPVIVVGNITVGGTGKTPLTIWLAEQLKSRGYSPGIVTRGYRGTVGSNPVEATADSEPQVVGDEAILLAKRSECPVVVHPNRVAAAELIAELGANVVIADDGLQHYRLARDFEIVVIDGERGFGNGRLLPAGPMREPETRLGSVEEILVQRDPNNTDNIFARESDPQPRYFELQATALSRLDGSDIRRLEDCRGKTVHAIAGIGNPERFFRSLESFGIEVIRHPLDDHAVITQAQLQYDDKLDLVMTEKDAVKCRSLETSHCWYVRADVAMDAADRDALLHAVLGKISPRVSV
jgi:tetraacyldisaccharide 4'-kinase